MAKPTRSDGLDPELLRRLREFQTKVGHRPRRVERSVAVVPSRAPVSGRDVGILVRLRRTSPQLADSFEQALTDLNDQTRLSYLGPAGEVREVMRATVQTFAPDDEVRKQPWFVGHTQGAKTNPTQAERTRYVVQLRRGDPDQVREVDALVDALIGKIGRQTYASGSGAFHGGTVLAQVRKLTNWVFAILDEVLPE